MWNLKKWYYTNELIYKTETESRIPKINCGYQWGCGVGKSGETETDILLDSPSWRRSAPGSTGQTGAKAKTPALGPPHAKSQLVRKDPDAGRDWGQEEKGTTEGEMAGRHPRVWLNSGSWWWTGRPGVLQFMGLQCVGHDWATELNW